MGNWAKDGSYQVEDGDIERMERAIASGNQAKHIYEQQQGGLSAMKVYVEEQKRKAEAEREFAVNSRETEAVANKKADKEREIAEQ